MAKVWDLWIRIGHWLLVLSVLLAWLTRHGGGEWHEWPGYVALALVVARIVWGFFGSQHARFSDFVHPPRVVIAYVRDLKEKSERHYAGHNPLGGYMAIALLAAVAATSLSGWLYTTDRFWGVEWVGATHDLSADLVLALAVLHVAGVLFTSARARENLVAAMFHGRKRIR